MKNNILLLMLVPTSLCGWSIGEVVSDTTSKVSSWFTKQQTQTSKKEYAIKTTSPITLTNHRGSVKITTWNEPTIMVDATKRGTEEEIAHTKFMVSIGGDAEKTVTIATEPRGKEKKLAAIDYALMVPRSAPVTVRTDSGNISVQDHGANLDLQTLDGSIAIEQSAKNVKAKAPHGNITVEQNELKDDASIFLEAERDITLVMPEDANTSINAHTTHGKIISDTIYLTLDPITTKLNKESYKQMQQKVRGTTGAGGVPITLESIRGNITIIGE